MNPDDFQLPKDNPLRNYSDPFADYRANMEKQSRENPKVLEFERLCYEVFIMDEQGRALYETLEQRHILDGAINPTHPQASNLALYHEGYRAAIRSLKICALQHQYRIANQTKG